MSRAPLPRSVWAPLLPIVVIPMRSPSQQSAPFTGGAVGLLPHPLFSYGNSCLSLSSRPDDENPRSVSSQIKLVGNRFSWAQQALPGHVVSESQKRREAKQACPADPHSFMSRVAQAPAPQPQVNLPYLEKHIHWTHKVNLYQTKDTFSLPSVT